MEKLYRYDQSKETENPLDKIEAVLHEFKVSRTTPKGAFVLVHGKQKFVLLSAVNKFAYESPELAMDGFVRRKRNEISILKSRLKVAEAYLAHCLTPNRTTNE